MAPQMREAAAALREFALGLPEAYEEFPWGECVTKVNKKVFVFFGADAALDHELTFSVKLPISGDEARSFPANEPARYNLGKSGWTKIRFLAGEDLPMDLLCHWIKESYRAVAPKRLVARLDIQVPQ